LKVLDALAKQNTAGIKKIKPGITGKIAPRIPRIKKITPSRKYTGLFNLFRI
jgi:hypothetical protein